MVERIKIAPTYESKWLEVTRPQPLMDNRIEKLIQAAVVGKVDSDVTDAVYDNFKSEAAQLIFNTRLNRLTGIDSFDRIDICMGCTQYIDNLYMCGPVQYITGDYRYHDRLRLGLERTPGNLDADIPLIIAMPFPSTGCVHASMEDILDECLKKNISVHIDGAWITCCRDIEFDFDHPAIASVGISLSKGLGLGWNRIGLRWTRIFKQDSITIMNDFHMNNRALVIIGSYFIRNLSSDYLWNTHGDRYLKVCSDFDLTPTNSIYLALRDKQPVGVSPLIRYLENELL
jgi:hypothetical protein